VRLPKVAARVDPDGAGDIAVAVSGAAGEVLALRARLRQGVLALIPEEPPPEEPSEEAPTPDFFEFIELD
jgi:hypothetical protein